MSHRGVKGIADDVYLIRLEHGISCAARARRAWLSYADTTI